MQICFLGGLLVWVFSFVFSTRKFSPVSWSACNWFLSDFPTFASWAIVSEALNFFTALSGPQTLIMISSCEDISCGAAALLCCEICHAFLPSCIHWMINNIWCLAMEPTPWTYIPPTIFFFFHTFWTVPAKMFYNFSYHLPYTPAFSFLTFKIKILSMCFFSLFLLSTASLLGLGVRNLVWNFLPFPVRPLRTLNDFFLHFCHYISLFHTLLDDCQPRKFSFLVTFLSTRWICSGSLVEPLSYSFWGIKTCPLTLYTQCFH